MNKRMNRRMPSARRQMGAVAIIVGLSLVVLIGAVGLALDLGKLFITKTELQNGADACALAASRELTGTNTNQLAIAEAAGISTGSRNRVLFQENPIALSPDLSVTFSETLNGTYQAKGAFDEDPFVVRYVRCSVDRSNIANWFIQVLNVVPGANITSSTVRATAVASLQPAQTTCALPVTICSNDPAYASAVRGTWLQSVVGSQDSLTGSFRWADFTPPNGGAAELAAQLRGAGVCNLPAEGAEIGQPGNVASLGNDWNSRFGVYQGGIQPGEAVPDFTGFAYTGTSWPSAFGAYSNFIDRRSANVAYQGNTLTGLDVSGTIQGSAFLSTNGADRRLAIVPVVDCSEFGGGSQTAAVQSWACILMLHPINNNSGGGNSGGGNSGGAGGSPRMYLEYLGASNDLSSPCATLGLPGSEDAVGPQVPVLVQ